MDYANALSKGRQLLKLLYANDSTAGSLLFPPAPTAQSNFLDASALLGWGYLPNFYNYSPTTGLYHLQQIYGIDPIHNTGIGHSHLDPCVQNGTYIPVTWAKFNSIVNAPGGMLIAVDNESPTALFRFNHKKITAADRLPELKYWSDVAYLQWKQVTKGFSQLRYVVRHGITNVRTIAVLRQLLERDGPIATRYGRMVWPDVTWRDEEAVAALVGTPNGSGVARLLIHHKKQLGHKVVEEVRLIGTGDLGPAVYGEPSLVFKIADVPGEEGAESVRGGGRDEEEEDDEDMGFWIFDLD